jgi:hypothetical protein
MKKRESKMEADIVEGTIGNVGSYDVEFKGGKLIAKAGVAHSPTAGVSVKADLSLEVGAEAVVDAIAKAIPGQIDDMVLGMIKAALLKV